LAASTRPKPTLVFTVTPTGECSIPEGSPSHPTFYERRLKAIHEEIEARKVALNAAESELRSRVGLGQLCDLIPCPENDEIYGAQSLDDPDILSLIASIKDIEVTDPIRISSDNVIISGHRRRFCAIQAGLTEVPVLFLD
jgi:hypothetical protein